MSAQCEVCGKHFSARKNLYRHVRNFHSVLKGALQGPEDEVSFEATRDVEEYPELCDILPKGFSYRVIKFNKIQENKFNAHFVFNGSSEETLLKWLKELERTSKVVFRQDSYRKPKVSDVIFKTRLRCHYNTRPKNPKNIRKNTNCPGFVLAWLKKQKEGVIFSENVFSEVQLNHVHNHQLNDSALRFRRPNQATVLKFKQLFDSGLSSRAACNAYLTDILQIHGENHLDVINDRSIVPERGWVIKYFHRLRRDKKLSSVKSSTAPEQEPTRNIKLLDTIILNGQLMLANPDGSDLDSVTFTLHDQALVPNQESLKLVLSEPQQFDHVSNIETKDSTPSEVHPHILNNSISWFESILEAIQARVRAQPQLYLESIANFVDNYETHLGNDEDLIVALKHFGATLNRS